MTVVVDTSVLIDHLRGDERARASLRRAVRDGERLVSSVLTRVEVMAGMRPDESDRTMHLLSSLDWVEVDESLAERAGWLANRFLGSHPGVDPVDYVIAATTERLEANLWTRNVRHFPMFPGLQPPY
jgi:predicted nucleic acid-binding protein